MDLLKINVVNTEDFENEYWDWFKNKMLKNLIIKISNHDTLKDVFFGGVDEFDDWFDRGRSQTVIKWFEAQDDSKFDQIKNYIMCKPQNLSDLKNKIDSMGVSLSAYKVYFENKYINLRNKKGEWFLESLHLKSCPYCNRSYTSKIIKKNGNVYVNFELDHFYNKRDYPVLALCLYNLVPSCHTCNHIKSALSTELIYPYLEEYGEQGGFKYKITPDFIDAIYGKKSSKVEVEFVTSSWKIDNSADTFGIKDIYKLHHDEAKALLEKKVIFSDTKIKDLIDEYLDNMGYSEEEIHRLLYSHYSNPDNHHLSILSKYLSDLYTDLKLKGI